VLFAPRKLDLYSKPENDWALDFSARVGKVLNDRLPKQHRQGIELSTAYSVFHAGASKNVGIL